MNMVRIQGIDHSVDIARDAILKYFPDSMLSRALELDSTCMNIELSRPCISREVLESLKDITTDYLPHVPENYSTVFSESSRYLLIPLLGVIGDPKFRYIQETFPLVNWIWLNMTESICEEILIVLSGWRNLPITRYILDRVQVSKETTQKLLERSCNLDWSEGIDLWIKAGADPSYEDNALIKGCIYAQRIEATRRLFLEDRTRSSFDMRYGIRSAVSIWGDTSILEILLTDTDLNESIINEGLHLAIGNTWSFHMLHRYSVKHQHLYLPSNLLICAIKSGCVSALTTLLNDPRTYPEILSVQNITANLPSSNNHRREIVEILMKHHRVRESVRDYFTRVYDCCVIL